MSAVPSAPWPCNYPLFAVTWWLYLHCPGKLTASKSIYHTTGPLNPRDRPPDSNSCSSVPPYRIVNRCRDVVIRLKQADWSRERRLRFPEPMGVSGGSGRTETWEDWDEIPPNTASPMPYAWDEPRAKHSVRVVATGQRDAVPSQVGQHWQDDTVTQVSRD